MVESYELVQYEWHSVPVQLLLPKGQWSFLSELQGQQALGSISVYFCIILSESAIKQYITVIIDIDPSNPSGISFDGFFVSSAMVAMLSKPPYAKYTIAAATKIPLAPCGTKGVKLEALATAALPAMDPRIMFPAVIKAAKSPSSTLMYANDPPATGISTANSV
ncbi:hypothetical protein H5410_008270 [Solanum commersonii]|uniref:Uncharacterized protein n=1 Tax=Solanum commersonii TaxID=4109 RepID=A0A9J6AFJ8_SOLCO|nr:hypothetical protein H5410_008270 [Solanum commersonii]